MEAGNIAGYVSLAVVGVRELINLINHCRVKSKCGEKDIVMSLDIDKTTPKEVKSNTDEPKV